MERPVHVPAWVIPPIYHSLRRESIKNTNSASAIGVKSVRPTWFEDIVTSREPAYHAGQEQPEPMHGLKLVIKEKALPLKEQPEFPAADLVCYFENGHRKRSKTEKTHKNTKTGQVRG